MGDLLREHWARYMQKRRSGEWGDDPMWICLANCQVLNTVRGSYSEDLCDVYICRSGKISYVDTGGHLRATGPAKQKVDCSGRRLMPGKYKVYKTLYKKSLQISGKYKMYETLGSRFKSDARKVQSVWNLCEQM